MEKYKRFFKEAPTIKTIDLKKVSNYFYHGSVIDSDFRNIPILNTSQSKFHALWVTDKEDIAKKFFKREILRC